MSSLVRIECAPPWFRIWSPLAPELEREISRALTAIEPDGTAKNFWHQDERKASIGLLYRTVSAFYALHVPTEVTWEPAILPPPMPGPLADGKVPRDDQMEAAAALAHCRRGTCWAGTGHGKTLVMAVLARTNPTARVLVMVSNIDPADQLVRELGAYLGEIIGLVQGTTWHPQRITVASMHTLRNRLVDAQQGIRWESPAHVLLRDAQIMLIDEVHTATHRTGALLTSLCRAPIRIGLSGTPFRDYDPVQWMRVEAMCGPVVYQIRAGELAARGLVPQSEVWMVPWGHPGMRVPTDEWPEAYEDGIVRCQARNDAIAQVAMAAIETGRTPLVVFQRQDHGPLIQEAVRRAGGPNLPCIDGNSAKDERAPVWSGIATGKLPGAVVSMISKQSLNLPALGAIVLASGRKANTEICQVIGRGLRFKPTGRDPKFYLFDMVDRHSRHLSRHTDRRLSIWQREGFHVQTGLPDWAQPNHTSLDPV